MIIFAPPNKKLTHLDSGIKLKEGAVKEGLG